MKCEDVQPRIEEYHDGELEPALQAQLDAHFESCKPCSRILRMLRAENEFYSAYRENVEQSISVNPQMWANVRAKLKKAGALRAMHERRRSLGGRIADYLSSLMPIRSSLRQVLAAAVLVVISVVGTLLVVRHNANRDEHMQGQIAASRSSGERNLESALRSIQRAEQEYLEAIRLLTVIVEKRRPSIDPTLVRELEANLKAIDESIAATRKAYLAHPSDPELAQYMLAAYSKKVELLLELGS
jgi:anti-sigma factor RsiW